MRKSKLLKSVFICFIILIMAEMNVNAESLHIEWEVEGENPDSFSLFDAGNTEVASFLGAERVGDFEHTQVDACSGYYMTATRGSVHSSISQIFTYCKKPPEPPLPIGSFIITVKPLSEN